MTNQKATLQDKYLPVKNWKGKYAWQCIYRLASIGRTKFLARFIATSAFLTFLLFSVNAQAQTLQPINAWGFKWNRGVFVNGLGIPADTATLTTEQRAFPHLAVKGENLYRWSVSQKKWVEAGGGAAIDPTSFVKYTDTAAMLVNYRHWLAGYLKVADIAGKLNVSDTAAMLQNYRHWLAGYLKSADIAGKLNISDTAAMLLTYRHWAAGYLTNITGLVNAGTNITITGNGTAANPYVISSTSSGGISPADTAGKWLHDVTMATTDYVDTLYKHKGSTISNIGQIYKPRGCEDSEGGLVTKTDSLTVYVSAWPFFCVNGKQYTFGGGSVTMTVGDANFPRYDLVVVDTLGNAFVIEGTPSAQPLQPQIDPFSQRIRTVRFVPAGSQEIEGVTNTKVFDQNLGQPDEANASYTGPTVINFNNTTQASSGNKSASIPSNGLGMMRFKYDTPKTVTDYATVFFDIRLGAKLKANQNVRVQLYLNGAVSSQIVNAAINKDLINAWQQGSVSFQQLFPSTATFDEILVYVQNANATTYIDNITLQAGLTTQPPVNGAAKGITVNVGGTLVQIPDGGMIEFAAGDARINIGLTGNPPKLTFTVNSFPVTIDSVEGLRDEMGTFVTDLFSRNDSLIGIRGGEEFFVDTVRLFYWDEDFFEGDGTPENRLRPKSLDSTGTPINFLYQDVNNKIRKASLSGLGGGGSLTGSGTADYLARWISSTALGVGAVRDNGTNAGIGTAPGSRTLTVASSLLVGTAEAGVNHLRFLTSNGSGLPEIRMFANATVDAIITANTGGFSMNTHNSVTGNVVASGLVRGSGLISGNTATYSVTNGQILMIGAGAGNDVFQTYMVNGTAFHWAVGMLNHTAGGHYVWKSDPTNSNVFTGTERMRLTRTNGNLLLGTSTDDTTAILKIDQTATTYMKGAMNAPPMTTTQRLVKSSGLWKFLGYAAVNTGSGYTNGTYTGVALTGGSGSGAIATISISANKVGNITITTPGTGYMVGDVLSASAASMGGTGSGFAWTLGSNNFFVKKGEEVYDTTLDKKFIWTGSWEALH